MTINTKSWTKTLSSPHILDSSGLLTTLGLVLLGLLAGLLQVHLRYPLNIPGHHGLEWMALLMFGRLLADHRCAATIVASGAAASYLVQSPFLALAHDIKPALIFLLTGACTDLLFRYSKNHLPESICAALVSGLAFVSKPMVMYCIFILTGLPIGMFIKHPDYLPFVSHLLFGLTGGAGGALLVAAVTRSSATKKAG